MHRFKPAVLLFSTIALFAGVVDARDLTSTEKTSVNGWLTTINDTNSSPTAVASAKSGIESLFGNVNITGHYWGLAFADFFDNSPGNSIHEPLADYFTLAPLDQAETLEYRRKFQAAVIMGAGQRLVSRVVGAGGVDALGLDMNDDCAVREDVLQALELLEVAAYGEKFAGGFRGPFVDTTTAMRNEFYDKMRDFVQFDEPSLLQSVTYAGMTGVSATTPWAGPIRAEMLRAIRGIKPTDDGLSREFSVDFGLPGDYATVLDDFNVLLDDNNAMSTDTRLATIWDFLNSLPTGAEIPRTIAIKDAFGNICPTAGGLSYPPSERDDGPSIWQTADGCSLPLLGYSGNDDNGRCIPIGVNIREHLIGESTRTPFPSTESSWPDNTAFDAFCEVLVHEVTHSLDPEDATFTTRRDAAITRACTNPLNYLRSQTGSFCGSNPTSPCTGSCNSSPVEFMASIANMYFMDSERTLKLAHRRIHCKEKDGTKHQEPMNQFLLMANMLAEPSTLAVPFYKQPSSGTCELAANNSAMITRNGNGCITSMTYQPIGGSTTTYNFTISTTNPTHCVVTAMTPTFQSLYPSDSCPQ